MPHSLSAKKRLRQAEKRQERNRAVKSKVHTGVKKVKRALQRESAEAAKPHLYAASREIDKAVAKGVLHPNTGARKKSRLWKSVNKAAAQPPAAES